VRNTRLSITRLSITHLSITHLSITIAHSFQQHRRLADLDCLIYPERLNGSATLTSPLRALYESARLPLLVSKQTPLGKAYNMVTVSLGDLCIAPFFLHYFSHIPIKLFNANLGGEALSTLFWESTATVDRNRCRILLLSRARCRHYRDRITGCSRARSTGAGARKTGGKP
jgi:hypothetical protein